MINLNKPFNFVIVSVFSGPCSWNVVWIIFFFIGCLSFDIDSALERMS